MVPRSGPLLAALFVALASSRPIGATNTFTVTNTNSSGGGSLVQAIMDANAQAGSDRIVFAIASGSPPFMIDQSGIALPDITDAVVIDGYTQTGSHPNTLAVGDDADIRIVVFGPPASSPFSSTGFTIAAPNCSIRGLVINRFSIGIQVNATGTTVAGNFIGVDPQGKNGVDSSAVTRGSQVVVQAASGNTIGGTTPDARNVILGGVVLAGGANGNHVLGNYIGTDATGTATLGGTTDGVSLQGADNAIGAPGGGNLIAGQAGAGIRLSYFGGDDSGNLVQANRIGTNAAATAALGNGSDGILLDLGATGNTIGGTAAGAGNVVGGSGENGITIAGGSTGNQVEGNFVGTDPSGTVMLPNAESGVRIQGISDGNTVGGTASGAGNVVAFNHGPGISIDDVNPNVHDAILGNSIYDNDGLGIDLLPEGVNPNSPANVSTNGPNALQNYPTLTSAAGAVDGDTWTVAGTLDSHPNATFRLEFFASPACDASGHGEGRTFVGTADVVTGPSGPEAFSAVLPAFVAGGQAITATATSADSNTSEFSTCVTSTGPAVRPTKCTAASCDDGNPCTVDVCSVLTCDHRDAIGFASVRCIFDSKGLKAPLCTGTHLPASVGKQINHARQLVDRAAAAASKKQRKLLKAARQAITQVRHAVKKLGHKAARRQCTDPLGALLADAQRRADALLKTLGGH